MADGEQIRRSDTRFSGEVRRSEQMDTAWQELLSLATSFNLQ
jgi:hypothetical protein